jgi:uncharacterized repeat protein (TIGR03803 family)
MMKSLRNLLGASLSAAVFSACSHSLAMTPNDGTISPLAAGATVERTHAHPAYSVLYSFKGGTGDGAYPVAGLINVNGTLYGTTAKGGAEGASGFEGIVFAITTSGKETVLHSFGGSGDGAYPGADLINVNGTLYGTTLLGGTHGHGTVFSVTTSGAETVLYSFKSGSRDGANPSARLLYVNGTLYGTTSHGGANCGGAGCGTVFKITTSGKETLLHSFGAAGDGAYPIAGLRNLNGMLYGTTSEQGANGHGTVFAITPSGSETVLHSFKGGARDGAYADTDLIEINGALYGTTAEGGGTGCSYNTGCGTAYTIPPSGAETVLYRFKGGSGDGAYPYAALLNFKGTLYSTTANGGGTRCRKHFGCGTAFSITTSGTETVIHDFKGRSRDGAQPHADLIEVDGRLYGTTANGGLYSSGTIFALTP